MDDGLPEAQPVLARPEARGRSDSRCLRRGRAARPDALPDLGERLQELRSALRRVQVAEAPDHDRRGPRKRERTRLVGLGQRGHRDPPDRPAEPALAHAVLDELRVHDHAVGVVEHLVDERELVGARFPYGRDQAVDHAVCDQTPEHARIALHCVEVAVPVPAPDRKPGDQVVQYEVVQDDDPAAPPQRGDDPAVGVGVVADVVERDVGAPRRPPPAAADDVDLETPLQLGQEQRAVVGDPRSLGGSGEK